ncbi:MAG: hypothetical protein ABIH08_02030 [Candidatus Omnitrophota bacterium]
MRFQKKTIIFFGVIIFVALEAFILLPERIKSVVVLNKKIIFSAEKVEAIKKEWPKREKYLEECRVLEVEIDKAKARIVSSQQESALLSFISTNSKDFGVEIQSLYPDKPQELASVNSPQLKYLPISIKAKSEFHGLVKFLEYLQNSSYFFEIKDLSVESGYPYNSIEALICAIIKEK